jgi:cytochrome c oxidase cbb3-type subunit IV
MSYEIAAAFAQTWGTLYAVLLFAGACLYAFWPRNADTFRRAADLPLKEDDEP